VSFNKLRAQTAHISTHMRGSAGGNPPHIINERLRCGGVGEWGIMFLWFTQHGDCRGFLGWEFDIRNTVRSRATLICPWQCQSQQCQCASWAGVHRPAALRPADGEAAATISDQHTRPLILNFSPHFLLSNQFKSKAPMGKQQINYCLYIGLVVDEAPLPFFARPAL
jgi:hypothetical protein